ncbi:26S proteasome regulatory subunit, ATPase 3, interacting protein [Trypanosoma grayi]|uniref:26S proteasome regulatory subunit, ATPase 3, interacting protein n=1 Tax=Trypanosoma grayi TaxID=71804 RepID=UPI0004F4A81D|nr:26S proteasome regulatory subunit, ATPase 3, interacting protein [Trypanosoma grayi]KEG10197.1 26S proteasome regulatory subunit, ATPase 3, interacting protein [Trypanosoma grayi]
MASKKGGKKPDGADAEAAILQWFECEGEPATVQSLTDALGSKYGKTLVQAVLEQCVSEQKLQVKDIKKARIYFPAPSEASENGMSHSTVDSEKTELVQRLQQKTKKVSALSAELAALLQKPSATERAASIAALSAECAATKQRLDDVREAAGQDRDRVSDEDICILIQRYNRAREIWRERKRMTERVIDATLGESCDPKDLAEFFGVTTDQQANVSMAETAIALPLTMKATHV